MIIAFVHDKDCVDHKWTISRNQLSAGAKQYSAAVTLQQCLDFCVNNVDCVAVDVNVQREPLTCWPHFNIGNLLDDNVYNQSGVDQYRLVHRCRRPSPPG